MLTSHVSHFVCVGGGLLAAPMVFVFPACMYRQVIMQQKDGPTVSQRAESTFAIILMLLGTALGLMGSWQALQEL